MMEDSELAAVADLNSNIELSDDIVEEEKFVDIDEFIKLGGEFGRYQIRLLFLLSLVALPVVFPVMIFYYIGISPDWQCLKLDDVSNTLSESYHSVCTNQTLNQTFPHKDLKRCKLNHTEWTYHGKSSIVSEFGLVCDKTWLDSLSGSIIFIGWGIGSIVSGIISDRYGRKKVLFPSMFLSVLLLLLHAGAQSIWQLIFTRFVLGLFFAPYSLNVYVLLVELVAPSKRVMATALQMAFAWPAGAVIMTVEAYYIDNWRMLVVLSSAPWLTFMVIAMYIPESFRWLHTKGDTKKAEQILRKAAEVNKTPLPLVKLRPVQIESEAVRREKKYTYLDFFRTWYIAKLVLVQGFIWFNAGMTYYGLSWAFADLGGDMYINFVISFFVEVPGNFLNVYLLKRFGRKKTTLVLTLLLTVFCLLVACLPKDDTFKVVRVTAGLTAKFMVSCVFGCVYLWSTEIYPTVVRTQGMGVMIVTSRIGAATSTFIKVLDQIHPAAPFTLLGGFSLISTLFCLVLPETLGFHTREAFDDFYAEKNNKTLEMRVAFTNGNVIIENEEDSFENEVEVETAPLLTTGAF